MGKLTSKSVESIAKAATLGKPTMAPACTSRYPRAAAQAGSFATSWTAEAAKWG